MFTYSGRWISSEKGEPCLLDIAVQLGRIARFCGATRVFWPVLLHSMVVADLLPVRLEIYGLLHDSTELYFSDIPGPEKPKCVKAAERKLFSRILKHLNFPLPSAADLIAVKVADERALHAEAYVLGGKELKRYFERDLEAECVVEGYANKYGPEELLDITGAAVLEFIERVRVCRK